MPWTARDTGRHNKKAAKSPKAKQAWSKTANAVLKRTGDEGQAIRVADSVANRMYGGKRK